MSFAKPQRQAPLEKLQKIWTCILDDRAKFDDVLHRLEARKKQLTESVVREKAELAVRRACNLIAGDSS